MTKIFWIWHNANIDKSILLIKHEEQCNIQNIFIDAFFSIVTSYHMISSDSTESIPRNHSAFALTIKCIQIMSYHNLYAFNSTGHHPKQLCSDVYQFIISLSCSALVKPHIPIRIRKWYNANKIDAKYLIKYHLSLTALYLANTQRYMMSRPHLIINIYYFDLKSFKPDLRLWSSCFLILDISLI